MAAVKTPEEIAAQRQPIASRLIKAVDTFMQHDLGPPVKTSMVSGPDFRTIPPQDARGVMKLQIGDRLKWIRIPGTNRYIVTKAMAIMLVVLAASALVWSPYHRVIAQEDPALDPPAEQTESPTETNDDSPPVIVTPPPVDPTVDDPVVTNGTEIEFIPLKEIGADVAHLPLSIQVVFPAGIDVVPHVERLNGNESRYTISIDAGNPDPSQSTLTFLTNSIDRWTVTVEENYDVEKVNAPFFIYVYGNQSQVWAEQDYFSGKQLKFKMQFVTSEAPHFPTPEENLATVIGPLNDIRSDIRGMDTSLENVARSIVYSDNLFQGATIVAILASFILLGNIIMLRRVMRQLEGRRQEQLDDEIDPNHSKVKLVKKGLFRRG